jgi:hypothetical protein
MKVSELCPVRFYDPDKGPDVLPEYMKDEDFVQCWYVDDLIYVQFTDTIEYVARLFIKQGNNTFTQTFTKTIEGNNIVYTTWFQPQTYGLINGCFELEVEIEYIQIDGNIVEDSEGIEALISLSEDTLLSGNITEESEEITSSIISINQRIFGLEPNECTMSTVLYWQGDLVFGTQLYIDADLTTAFTFTGIIAEGVFGIKYIVINGIIQNETGQCTNIS